MYRCKVCKKIYPNKVQYCDCGNDEFEQIVQQVSSTRKSFDKRNFLSWVIFSLCIIAAVLVWFI